MGNNLPASAFGNIYLKTNNPFYYAGENVTGEIYLNLVESFPGNSIFLKIKGKEECEFDEVKSVWKDNPDGTRIMVQETHHLEGHNIFYRLKFPVYVWNSDSIQPGQYCFPFAFIMGGNMAGSFYENENQILGKIKYKIKVELSPGYNKYDNVQGSRHHENVKKMKCTQELIIREPIKNPQLYNIPVENSVISKTWCCVNQGISKIKCFFEKNTYCPKETANMMCEVDNSNCNLNVRAVNMSLLMNIRLRAANGVEKNISETVNSFNLGGISAHETALGDKTKIAGILLTNQVRNRGLQPSTNGNLVKCEYYLSIKTVLDGVTCCASDPEVRIPLTIFAAPLMNFNQIQAPANWQPEMMPVYNCVLSDGFSYPNAKQVGLNIGSPPPQPFGIMAQPQMNMMAAPLNN